MDYEPIPATIDADPIRLTMIIALAQGWYAGPSAATGKSLPCQQIIKDADSMIRSFADHILAEQVAAIEAAENAANAAAAAIATENEARTAKAIEAGKGPGKGPGTMDAMAYISGATKAEKENIVAMANNDFEKSEEKEYSMDSSGEPNAENTNAVNVTAEENAAPEAM